MFAAPFVELDGVAHVAFRGLTWETGRDDGLRIRGGERCLLAGCTVHYWNTLHSHLFIIFGLGAWIAAWGNWTGLAVFLALGLTTLLYLALQLVAHATLGADLARFTDAPLAVRIDATLTAISTAVPHVQAGKAHYTHLPASNDGSAFGLVTACDGVIDQNLAQPAAWTPVSMPTTSIR
mgnify:CR=1 FL=1